MSEWQPIETAPTDGTEILLTPGNERDVTVGWYSKFPSIGGRHWRSVEAESNHRGDGWNYTHIFPTHWMPLPAPPRR